MWHTRRSGFSLCENDFLDSQEIAYSMICRIKNLQGIANRLIIIGLHTFSWLLKSKIEGFRSYLINRRNTKTRFMKSEYSKVQLHKTQQ